MAIFDIPFYDPRHISLSADRILLRFPRSEDYDDWAELRKNSRDHLQPWEPLWAEDDLSKPRFRQRLRFYNSEIKNGTGAPFFVFETSHDVPPKIIGAITISNIRRGVAQMGNLGYWIGQDHIGKGYATQAVELALHYAYNRLGLMRIEAATIPTNTRSRRVLEKSGFEEEGLARAYLNINGKREDHVLYAHINPVIEV